jgi:hypothetical protein
MIDGHLESSIHGWGSCVLELLPDPKVARYRFSADLACKHGSNLLPEAGIFFGAISNEGRHAFWSVLLNEPPLQGREPTWHHVDVDVANGAFQAWLDQRLILDAKPVFIGRELQSFRNMLHDPMDKSVSDFDPRGGLGLYIAQGQAAFRNVFLTPRH